MSPRLSTAQTAGPDTLFAVAQTHDLRHTQPIDATERIRAHARMEQIMATPTSAELAGRHLARRPRLSRRQLAFRIAAVPVAAGAIVAASTWIPGVGTQPAFASWTPIPSEVSGPLQDSANAACIAAINAAADPAVFEAMTSPEVAEFEANHPETFSDNYAGLHTPLEGLPIVTEQRGDWMLLSYAGDDISNAGCLFSVIDGQPKVESRWVLGNGSWAVADHARTESTPDDVGSHLMMAMIETPENGIGSLYFAENDLPDGLMMVLSATTGNSVTGAIIHPNNGADVVATVAENRLVAWWPSAETDGGWDETLSGAFSGITLQLADGSTREVPVGSCELLDAADAAILTDIDACFPPRPW